MKILAQNTTYLLVLFLLIFGLSGCAGGVVNVRVEPASYQPSEKINIKVMLNLTEDFRKAKWEDKPVGWEANVIHLGENFAINAENLANTIFADVVMVNAESEIASEKGDVILTPKMISAKQNRPMWGWEDSILTVIVEWSLKDLQGNLIWITTIKGEGITKLGDDKGRLRSLIKDLFQKSYTAISSSSEIRNYRK